MERRGRIPVAKFRTQEAKTRSRSRVREPDYNEQDPETDLFTLLEDNIALKEENKCLKLEIEEQKKLQTAHLVEKNKLMGEIEVLKGQHYVFEEEIKSLIAKNRELETEAFNKINEMHLDQMNLNEELKILKSQENEARINVIESPTLKTKILKILPDIHSKHSELESLMDIDSFHSTFITIEIVESLIEEFIALKNSMNGVELQLYEANEKISELIENQHHLEEENESLRNENANLTKVAKLLTENMKESVETSKKMEAALIKLKQRNDELTAKSRDQFDGQTSPNPSPTTVKANEDFQKLQSDVEKQNEDHNERIVEMKILMEAAIQKSTNDEIKTLQLKLEVLQEELRKAVQRAENAENELKKFHEQAQNDSLTNINFTSNYSNTSNPSYFNNATDSSTGFQSESLPSIPTPPPPPPLPANLLYKATNLNIRNSTDGTFKNSISNHSLQSFNGSKVIENVKHQVQPAVASGLDALVRELKSGRVTLRRNRRVNHTNEALKEMFQVLEISQTQNRNSQICIDMHI